MAVERAMGRLSQQRGGAQFRLFEVLAGASMFVLGLGLQFNFFGPAIGLPTLRLSDTLVIAGCVVLIFLLRLTRLVAVVSASAVVCGVLLLSVIFKEAAEKGDTYFTIMLGLSFILCMLWLNMEDRNRRRLEVLLATGFLIGMAMSAVVLVLRASHVDLTSIGLGTPRYATTLYDLSAVKPGGIWSQGNEAGHVYAMGAAPALYLSLRFRRPIIYSLYFGLFLLTFAITLNRAGVFGPVAGLVIAFLVAGRGSFLLKVSLGILGAIGVIWLLAHLPGLEDFRRAFVSRFASDTNVNHNAAERLSTFFAGIQVALQNPFGIGFVQRARELVAASGIASGSPHNAFISLAYQSGIATTVIFILSLVRIGFQPFRRWSLAAMFAVFAVPSMMFEELTLNPVFLFAIGAGIAVAATSLVTPRQPRFAPGLR